jgi:hypothetical protein
MPDVENAMVVDSYWSRKTDEEIEREYEEQLRREDEAHDMRIEYELSKGGQETWQNS